MSAIQRSIPIIIVLIFSHVAQAQRSRGGYDLPEVGSQLPEVTVFNPDGSEFSTQSLRGHYSVLVFGCLT